jgi:hypothetical protein
MFFLYLMACAGLTFGIQHKVPFLHKKFSLMDRLLACTYCAGFHSGWIMYVVAKHAEFKPSELLISAFASAMFSYSLDEVVKYLEESSQELE